MKPQHIIIAVIATLIALSAPASAINTKVVSINTNATDFNNAQTLTNIDVDGSGKTASADLRQQERYTFENQATDSGVPDSWTVTNTGNTINVTSRRSYGAGTQSMYGDGDYRVQPSTQPYNEAQTGNISWSWYGLSGNKQSQIRVKESGTILIQIGLRNGDLQHFDGNNWVTITTDVDYQEWANITIYNIDPGSSTYAVTWNTENGETGSASNLNARNTPTNGYTDTTVLLGSGGGEASYVDNYNVTTPDTATYIGQNHSADYATIAFANLTLQNADATIKYQELTGSTWNTYDTKSVSSSGNYTASIDPDNSDKYRVNITLTKTTGPTTAAIEDEGIIGAPDGNLLINDSNDPDNLVSTIYQNQGSSGDNLRIEYYIYRPNGALVDKNTTVTGLNSGDETKISLDHLTPTQKYYIEVDVVAQDQSVNYYSRNVIIPNASGNHTRYIYTSKSPTGDNRGNAPANTTFSLQDSTGKFAPDSTELYIDRPINKSVSYRYREVAGDRFGASGTINEKLESDIRYRLRLVNRDTGDTKSIGPIRLEPGTITVPLETEGDDITSPGSQPTEGYRWNASYVNESGTYQIEYKYNDTLKRTSRIGLLIYERGDRQNVIYDQNHTGTYGLFTHDQVLNSVERNKTWVVQWNATRDGDEIGGQQIVGPGVTQNCLLGFCPPQWFKSAAGMGIVMVVLGLFSSGNREIGGIATMLVAALLWWVGWLPPEVGGGVVFLALALSSLYYIRSPRRSV